MTLKSFLIFFVFTFVLKLLNISEIGCAQVMVQMESLVSLISDVCVIGADKVAAAS